MNIKVTVNGQEIDAFLESADGVLKLELQPPDCPAGMSVICVDRTEVRASLTRQATVMDDHDLWWDGYNEALHDVERAAAAGKPTLQWAQDTRQKFGLKSHA